MFDWLRRFLWQLGGDDHQSANLTLDALNAEAGSGEPTFVTKVAGNLKLPSGTLMLADPQNLPGLEVPNIRASEVGISVSLWRYPSGMEIVTDLTICLGEEAMISSRRKIGEVVIDSAKLVVADALDVKEHWADVGNDRLGVISTAQGDTVLRMLTKRFKLKAVRVNAVRADVVGPVSDQLAQEIEDYLKSKPQYADYPFMHFQLRTSNSFDRVNKMTKAWDFMPVGNTEKPLMFVCGTGRGDGAYDVQCEFSGEIPRVLSVTFIET